MSLDHSRYYSAHYPMHDMQQNQYNQDLQQHQMHQQYQYQEHQQYEEEFHHHQQQLYEQRIQLQQKQAKAQQQNQQHQAQQRQVQQQNQQQQGYMMQQAEHMYTPMKDLPPSLGFGSSSSPYYESSSPAPGHSMSSLQWSTNPAGFDDANDVLSEKFQDMNHLLPSQFPPENFANLESSPPVPHNIRSKSSNSSLNAINTSSSTMRNSNDRSASPRPKTKKRKSEEAAVVPSHTRKRGRPRKYVVIDPEDSSTLTNATQPSKVHPHVHTTKKLGRPRKHFVNDQDRESYFASLNNGRAGALTSSNGSAGSTKLLTTPKKRSGSIDGKLIDTTPIAAAASIPASLTPSNPFYLKSATVKRPARKDCPNTSTTSSSNSTPTVSIASTVDVNPVKSPSLTVAEVAKLVQTATPKTSQVGGRPLVYNSQRTSNGVPLFSSQAFRVACESQTLQRPTETSDVDLIQDYEEKRRHFSTNGLGFNFSISISGAAEIEKTSTVCNSAIAMFPKAHSTRRLAAEDGQSPMDSSISDFLAEDSGSDSDASDSEQEISRCDDPVRTPPRFSSLGNSDAATAFARALGRAQNQGFMFLFPNESTPDKPPHLSSNIPCTPRTPRFASSFDDLALDLQMQTPPGANFSWYDYPMGNFFTGLTPGSGMTPHLGLTPFLSHPGSAELAGVPTAE